MFVTSVALKRNHLTANFSIHHPARFEKSCEERDFRQPITAYLAIAQHELRAPRDQG